LLLGVALLAACNKTEPTPPDAGLTVVSSGIEVDPALLRERIKVADVLERKGDTAWTVPGEVVPSESGEGQVTSLVTGRVASLEVTEGTRVKRGQVMATIQSPDVVRAAADVVRALARAEVAARRLARQEDLKTQKATSQDAYDQAFGEDRLARAEVAAARTLLVNLGGTEPDNSNPDQVLRPRVPVVAPMDGVVVSHDAILGGPVTLDKPLFRILATGHHAVIARVPEALRNTLLPGTLADVRPRNAEDSAQCTAAVVNALGVVDHLSQTVPVRMVPQGQCPWLLPGGFVTISIRLGSTLTRVVPAAAVVDLDGMPHVFVQKEGGRFESRDVKLGPLEGNMRVILDGVTTGEHVAVTGTLLLKGETMRTDLGGE
jgi:cobalt-zinc-cadmium efflux system membrane fusion protein